MNGRDDKKPRNIECSRCGCEWNISIKAHIPKSGYVCPHCTSREREGNSIQEGKGMANRKLLHKSKIEDFKSWLQADGWQIEKTKGIYEIVRARKGDRKPLIVYTRDNKGSEHITVQSRDEAVVRAYIRDRKREAWAKANGVEKITREKAKEIWDSSPIGREDYTPLGRFYYMDGKMIIGIDNSSGGAWTEEFRHWDTFKLWITTTMSVEEAEKISGRRMNHGKGNSIRNQKGTGQEARRPRVLHRV